MAKKNKAPVIFFIVTTVIGAGIMFYPAISEQISSWGHIEAILTYHEELAQVPDYRIEELLAQAHSFNQRVGTRPFGELEEEYLQMLRFGITDVIGHVQIPDLQIDLPIFHGTSHSVLQRGVGHLEGYALPVGGENTHTALSAHRGLPSAMLFTRLDEMEIGDIFVVRVLNEVLIYEVDQIREVLPNDTSYLATERGRDLATLITCTPYGVNSHRLLVRGSRLDICYDELFTPAIPIGDFINWESEPVTLPFQSQVLLASAALALIIKIILEIRQKRLRELYLKSNSNIGRSKLA